MLLRVLGSAAGGGFPQWNCACPGCRAAREGKRARPRSQSSLAVRSGGGPWILVNASPDVRSQLELLRDGSESAVRASPVSAIILTDAEIDHTAGLILLREAAGPLTLFSTAAVKRALSEGFPVIPVLERYCGVRWNLIAPGGSFALHGAQVEVFAVRNKPPNYYSGKESRDFGVGLTFRAAESVATYAPTLAELDDTLLARFEASDVVLLDGTFWSDNELHSLGIASRSAREMGHLPLSGPGGTLQRLARLRRPRRILVHINNTNPVLLEGSPERRLLEEARLEIAYDGMNIELHEGRRLEHTAGLE